MGLQRRRGFTNRPASPACCSALDRRDPGAQGPLAHLGRLVRDLLAQLLDHAGLPGAVGLELSHQVLDAIRHPLVVLDFFHLADLIGRQLLRHGHSSVSTRPSSDSAGVRSSSRASVGAMSIERTRPAWTAWRIPGPKKTSGTWASRSVGCPCIAIATLGEPHTEYGFSVTTSSTPASGGSWWRQRRTTGSLVSWAASRVASAAITLSTSTPWAASTARLASNTMPVSITSQSPVPPPTRWSSTALALRITLSGITRTAALCPMARERSGNGVTPWSAVSTTSTLSRP